MDRSKVCIRAKEQHFFSQPNANTSPFSWRSYHTTATDTVTPLINQKSLTILIKVLIKSFSESKYELIESKEAGSKAVKQAEKNTHEVGATQRRTTDVLLSGILRLEGLPSLQGIDS